MPITVNSNPTATVASFNLSRANDLLRHSLAKLSSGNRIIRADDDAGGLAVAYKMESALKRTEAVRINVQNGLSFLQVQDGGLKVIGKIEQAVLHGGLFAMAMPRALSREDMPSTPLGATSDTPSQPSVATPRSCNQGRQSA